ncbi:hypothetical protein JKP88DRAFT_247833 [Tribonema minus]|uniref:Uncharacterized protein n=1 Tax=Tribonema minus TaxID=303371 RepID=A0A835YYF5_9STRA|nr:hypothetical protein JKP88DRAFT_247833 [Tribonema minus]
MPEDPPVRALPPPPDRAAAGAQCDACLLAPRARRAINDYDARRQRAEALLRQAAQQRLRLAHLLARRHPHGALRVDSEANPETVVYAAAAQRRRAAEGVLAAHAQRRRERLDELIGRPELRFGFDPLAPLPPPATAPAQHCSARNRCCEGMAAQQRKARPATEGSAAAAAAAHTTHERLFERDGGSGAAPRPQRRSAARAQALADAAHGGKTYDIVTNAALPPGLAPSVPERVCRWLAHPSQASLERGRNRQGALVAA